MLQCDIVLLILDTQRADRLSCYGYPIELSPHLDAFSAEATQFNYAIAPAQWTLPTHASLFTGLYPPQHNMFQLNSVLPKSILTLAERLQIGGYLTAGFSENPLIGLANNGLQRGFNIFRYYRNGKRLYLFPKHSLHNQPDNYKTKLNYQLTRAIYSVRRLADVMGEQQSKLRQFNFASKWSPSLNHNNSQTLNDAARLLIKRPNIAANRPIFAVINLMGVHPPYNPPHWTLRRFVPTLLKHTQADEVIKRINMAMLQDYGWLGPFLNRSLDQQYLAILNGIYNAEVAAQDAQIGSFVQILRQQGRLDSTLVIIVADHGDHLGEKQMLGHASGVYNEIVRVPLLIRDPYNRLVRGSEVSRFVSTRFLFHTILHAGDVATNEEYAFSLLCDRLNYPNDVFVEARPVERMVHRLQHKYPDLEKIHQYDHICRAVFREKYKLITNGIQQTELYNVLSDLKELHNLYANMPKHTDALCQKLNTFVDQTQPIVNSALVDNNEDAIIVQHLRELGYLE